MLITTIVLFAIAALFGMYLLSYVLRNKSTPKGVVFIHGPVAAIALFLLIVYAMSHHPGILVSIGLFALAALVGFVLFYRDITGKSIPKWLAITHGLVATAGFIFLLIYAFMT